MLMAMILAMMIMVIYRLAAAAAAAARSFAAVSSRRKLSQATAERYELALSVNDAHVCSLPLTDRGIHLPLQPLCTIPDNCRLLLLLPAELAELVRG